MALWPVLSSSSRSCPWRAHLAGGMLGAMAAGEVSIMQGMEGSSHGTHLASDDGGPAGACAPTDASGRVCPGADPGGRVLGLPHMERENSLRALSPQFVRRTARGRGVRQRAG